MTVTILTNGLVLTMDPEQKIIHNGSVVIKNGKIDAILQKPPDPAQYPEAETINMENKALIPGFINAHTHIAMAPFKGIVHDRPNVLYDIVWPIETSLTEENCFHLARLGALEALKAGSVGVADHYFFMDAITEGIIDVGLRGFVGETIMDLAGPFASDESLSKGISFWHRWREKNRLIQPVLAPHAPDTVSKEALLNLKDFSEQSAATLHIHLAQTQLEYDEISKKHNKSPVHYLYDIGFLGANVVAAHCIYMNEADIHMLFETNTNAIYCPSTHAFGGHVAPVARMVDQKVNVGLGTDFVAENDDHNVFEEMRLATMLQKVIHKDPTALPTRDVIKMPTINAAKAYGVDHSLGSLEVGKSADIVVIDLKTARLTPHYNITSALVYAASEADVYAVLIQGEFVIDHRKVLTVCEEEIIEKGKKACQEVLVKAIRKKPVLERYIDTDIRQY